MSGRPTAHFGRGPGRRLADPDVLVVGGGPAGSTVAGLLAREGLDVLVVDRAAHPRPKPCGECVNPGAVRALDRLGLLPCVEALHPARLRGWRVRGSGQPSIGDFGDGNHGFGIARARLDHALLSEAVRRGARLVEGLRLEDVTPATDVTPAPDGPRAPDGPDWRPRARLRGPDGTVELRPRVVVGADGLRSRVARCLPGMTVGRGSHRKVSLTCRLEWPSAPDTERGALHVQDGVTLGLAPVDEEGGSWNATVVAEDQTEADLISSDPLGFLEAVLDRRLGPDPQRRVVGGPWASGPFDRPVARAWAPGMALVGDAAGYYDPFTGQGIYRALRSAELLAPAVAAALAGPAPDWRPLREYSRRWNAEVRPSRSLQKVVDAVMRRRRLRDAVLAVLGRSRALDGIVRVTGDVHPVTFLLRARWWGPALLPALSARPPDADHR